MEKIVIENDSTIENVRLNFRHILPKIEDIEKKRGSFKPLESLSGHIYENFFPSALTSLSAEEALRTLSGKDELELFFMILLSQQEDAPRHVSTELLEKLKAAKDSISKENYINMLVFMLAKFGNFDGIMNEIMENMTEPDPVAEMLLSFYDETPREIRETETQESLCTVFIEAIKAEKSGDYSKAFSLMLKVFKGSDLHPFIFEILKFYILQYSGISPEDIAAFTKKVTESSLPVSFTTVKFVEFCYYYKNNIEDKLEESVASLAENTDSVFILNIIAPILYKYKKWHLVGKFYKMASKKAVGAEKTMYLELLADLYENKLELPDFASEIYRSIVEEDPVNCTFSLSKAASIYEENESWEKLASLYSLTAERETNPLFQAAFFSKTGEIFLRRLNNPEKASEYFEKSLSVKYSFETARMLTGLSIVTKNYERCVEILTTELENASEKEDKIRILKKLADYRTVHCDETEESEKYLRQILEIDPKNIDAVKKLGLVYSREKNWEKLTEINFKEIDLSKNIAEIAYLYYKNGVIFYENIKDLTRAAECFRELLDIEPEHLPTMLYLEKIFAKTHDTAGTNLIVSQIADMNADGSETGLSYIIKSAMIMREKGQTKKAMEIFREILKNHPENITAKENLRMLEGKADFMNIETESIDYNEYNFELFMEYIKQSNSSFMTDEILKREVPSFWKELYFLYKEGTLEKSYTSDSDSEKFILSVLKKDFSVNIMIKNTTSKTALMFLTGEYIKAGFFEGVSAILDYYLKFEPKNKRKIWSLFFRGCENPTLLDDLEELFTTVSDKQIFNIVREILEHIYIKNKDIDTLIFMRNITLQKIDDNKEKCRFIDETISLAGENIADDKLVDLYRKRIKFTEDEDLSNFLKIPENLERYTDMLLSEGRYETAEESIKKFVPDQFEQKVLFSKTAKKRNDAEKENELLKSIMFEAVVKKAAYPLNRLAELNRDKKRLYLFIEKALNFICGNNKKPVEPLPNLFALEKEKLFEFAGFNEKDGYLREFIQIASSIPDKTKTKTKAKPLHPGKHRILIQLIEYIRLSCNFDELEGLWDEESSTTCKALLSQAPFIVFGPDSLNTDFEKLKFTTLRQAFLLSCGLSNTATETAEKIFSTLNDAVKEKIKFVRSIRPSFQNRAIELLKLLENTDVSEIRSCLEKLNEASIWSAFYIDPDIEETKDYSKTEEFVNRFFI